MHCCSFSNGATEVFGISTRHKTLTFSAAHFICHNGWREFLHGHNYKVGLFITATQLGKDGYICDFKEVEAPIKQIVELFKGKLIVPTLSKSLTMTENDDETVTLVHGRSKFVLPKEDCAMVDVEYSSVEELAKWITLKFVEKITKETLIKQYITSLRLDLYETEDRSASYFYKVE